MKQPLVKNAADPQQVERATQLTKLQRNQQVLDLQAVLATIAGRRLIWRWLNHLRPTAPLWESSALIHYRVGFHDVAVMMLNEIEEADPGAYVLMLTEAREQQKAKDASLPTRTEKEEQ